MNNTKRLWVFQAAIAIFVATVAASAYGDYRNKDNAITKVQKAEKLKKWFLGSREYRLNMAHFPKDALEIVKIVERNPENFHEGFFIVVKNISGRPIYFTDFWVHFSSIDGMEEGLEGEGYDLKISFGNGRLINTTLLAGPNDIFAKPGSEFELTIDHYDMKGLLFYLSRLDQDVQRKTLSKIILRPQMISFGDGTGCSLGTCASASNKEKNVSMLFEDCSNLSCAKWSFNKDVNGCLDADENCKVDTINSNIGGDECGKIASRTKFCSSIWGTINCKSYYLGPCAGWDDV